VKVIYKLAYRIYRLGTLSVHWSRRRFTMAGMCVAGGFIATSSLGADMDNTVTYQTFVLLLGLLVPAIIFSWFFFGKFSIQRSLPRFGSVGQPLRYRVTVKNLTATAQNDLALMDNLIDPRPKFDEWLEYQRVVARRSPSFRMSRRQSLRHPFRLANVKETTIPQLPPRGEAEAQVELLPLRRGILRFTGATLARTDPLGLYRSFVHVANVQTVLILPKRYPLPPIALPGSLKYQEGGVAMASNIGRSDEFVSLRDYRRGDPMRHIHWRSWAKAGKPIVKEFEDQFFVRHALVLDTFTDDPRSELLEEAISVAASFACTVLTQESLLDLLFVGAESYCFTAGRGLGNADQMLEILAAVQPCRDRPFQMLENLVVKHAVAVSGCICIFLEWDEPRQNFVKKLRALNVPLIIFVVTEFGEKKPDAGVMRDEPENFHVLELGKVEQTLARLNS
jgi:uncharacterized protein (DUF58 family)